ncbi:hypothetical protein BDF21DRAFT_226790 [Thamnidium elegans]|nr:hypothetical protein BDF21DRAFT_226790 [Thamnidium elegans]
MYSKRLLHVPYNCSKYGFFCPSQTNIILDLFYYLICNINILVQRIEYKKKKLNH